MSNENRLFKIYTGDYTKNGYDSGISDSKKHIPKNKFKVLKILHPINYIWKFGNSFDSFTKNYDKGYLDGQRVNHQVYSSTQPKGTNMTTDNFSNHLRMLNEVNTNLTSLKRYMNDMRENYKKQIDVAENGLFLEDFTNPLKEKHQRFSGKVDGMISQIDRDLGKIKNQQEHIQRMMQIARNP